MINFFLQIFYLHKFNMNIDVHFDWKFYLDLYPDLQKAGINTQEKAYQHYINHGKNEGRACHPYCLEKNILEIQNQNKQQQINFLNKQEKKKEESYFNILIRTSNRPEMFHKCIQSILDQKYINYKIWVCFDKIESLGYLHQYGDKINYFPIYFDNPNKYKFNLYNNELMKKVTKGWILFIDDDDIYIHSEIFQMINNEIDHKKQLIAWKFARPDKIIEPQIKLGHMDTSMFCFHSDWKDKGKWNDQQYGDIHFVENLLENCNLELRFCNFIGTKVQMDTSIGNFGN